VNSHAEAVVVVSKQQKQDVMEGRCVKMADGTDIDDADTEAKSERVPAAESRRRGCGFSDHEMCQ
jgi:hypothetical protein